MSYRSLRIRPFRTSEDSTSPSPIWVFMSPYPARRYSTYPHFRPRDGEIAKGSQQLDYASRESEEDVTASRVTNEGVSIQDEISKLARESQQSETSISSTQPTFHSTYSREGKSHSLFLPEVPKTWGPRNNNGEIAELQRLKLLRSAFLEAASNRLHRRSQIISRAVKSEARLQALSNLLYPYRRRPMYWERNFYLIFQSRRPSNHDGNHIPGLRFSQFADEWFQDLFKNGDIEAASVRWQQLSSLQQRKRWPHIMLKCLVVSTKQAFDFLLATHVKPLPPFEIVMDAMLYLKRARADEINSSTELRDQYMQVLSKQLQPTRWIYHMERKHLDLLLEDCTGEEGRHLFEKLLGADVDLTDYCMLIFMDFFTRIGNIDLALKALNGIDLHLRRRPNRNVLSRCMNLLKLDTITSDGTSPNFRILPQILQAGVKPSLALHNIIMKNAVNLGASVVAWDLFRYIQEHDLPSDARTYLILLQDSLARRDAARLQEILDAIHKRDDLSKNPHLIVYTLTVIRVIHGQDLKLSPRVVFSNMLAIYSRAFSTAPLRHLKMVSGNSRSLSSPNQLDPDVETLSYVVQSYVLAQHSPMVVQSLFDWTEHLRSECDDLALALTQCLPVYDGYIAFFARRSETLPRCLQIIQAMLDRKVQPSATTWGILALAFTKHGQPQAAEEVRGMMDRQGIRLEEKTVRLIMELQPHADPARLASPPVQDQDERSKEVSLGRESAHAHAGQDSKSEIQDLLDPVDDATFSNDFHHSDVSEGRQLNTPDISDGVALKTAQTAPRRDLSQLEKQLPAQPTSVQPAGQISNDPMRYRQSLDNNEDDTVHNFSTTESYETGDLDPMCQDELDLLLLAPAPVTTSKMPHVQQVNGPSPGPVLRSASTPESDAPDKVTPSHIRLVHVKQNLRQAEVDNRSSGTQDTSGLVFEGLVFGTEEDEDSVSWARREDVRNQEAGRRKTVKEKKRASNEESARKDEKAKAKKGTRDKIKAFEQYKEEIQSRALQNSRFAFTNVVFTTEGEASLIWARTKEKRDKEWAEANDRDEEEIQSQARDSLEGESGGQNSQVQKEQDEKSLRVPKASDLLVTGFVPDPEDGLNFGWAGMPDSQNYRGERQESVREGMVSRLTQEQEIQNLETNDEGFKILIRDIGAADPRASEPRGPRMSILRAGRVRIMKVVTKRSRLAQEKGGEMKMIGEKVEGKKRNASADSSVSRLEAARIKHFKERLTSPQPAPLHLKANQDVRAEPDRRPTLLDLPSEHREWTNNNCDKVEPDEGLTLKSTEHENDLILPHYKKFYATAEAQMADQNAAASENAEPANQGGETRSHTSGSIEADQREDASSFNVRPEIPPGTSGKVHRGSTFNIAKARHDGASPLTEDRTSDRRLEP
jgi:hypothetical protein